MWWGNTHALALWSSPSLEEFLSRDYSDMSEATRTRLKEYQKRFLKGEVVEESWTFYPHGKPQTVLAMCSGYTLPNGSIALLLEAYPHDKQIEATNEIRMIEAVRHTASSIALFSFAGDLLLSNPAAMRTFSSVHAETTYLDLFVDAAQGIALRDQVKEKGRVHGEYELQTNQGKRWFKVTLNRSNDPASGELVLLFDAQDITERVQLTQLLDEERQQLSQRVDQRTTELRQLNQVLESAVQARDGFLANMSHELRTPLNAIIGYSELLLEEAEEAQDTNPDLSTGESIKWLNNVLESANYLFLLVADMLDLSSVLSEHGLTLQCQTCSVVPLCEASIRRIRPMLDKHKHTIQTSFPDDLPPIFADPLRIEQVLVNLLTNAIKYTPLQREIGIDVSQYTDEESGQTRIHIEIWDQGEGIPAEAIETLFDPFTQFHREKTQSSRHGVGLGLALVQRLLALHDGTISVESEVDKGSRFRISLPTTQPN
jgi:signal transduction histidine kinase